MYTNFSPIAYVYGIIPTTSHSHYSIFR